MDNHELFYLEFRKRFVPVRHADEKVEIRTHIFYEKVVNNKVVQDRPKPLEIFSNFYVAISISLLHGTPTRHMTEIDEMCVCIFFF